MNLSKISVFRKPLDNLEILPDLRTWKFDGFLLNIMLKILPFLTLFQDTISQTTKPVRYDSKPSQMVVVQQIPQKIFVGSYMRYSIQVAMLDETGESMTEVGYMGDPMKISASAIGADIENPETHFIPGSGLAKFGKMVFNSPGNFNLKIELTYKGMANVTVDPVHTIRFEVTADVPDRIEIGLQPDLTVEQLVPLSPVQILIYDSNNNQMTGDILTANDPWRVCASLVPSQMVVNQNLLGTLEAPFRDGVVTFTDLALSTKATDVILKFEL